MYLPLRVHKVATVDFWHTFGQEDKIGPGWWGVEGACPPPLITFTITSKVAVGRHTNPVSSLGKYVLCDIVHRVHIGLEMK